MRYVLISCNVSKKSLSHLHVLALRIYIKTEAAATQCDKRINLKFSTSCSRQQYWIHTDVLHICNIFSLILFILTMD
jgi:hypothetical protein